MRRTPPEFEIFKCYGCSVEFSSARLTAENLDHLYSEGYYSSWGASELVRDRLVRKMKIETFKLRLHTIKRFVPYGHILDVGCATGYFLEAANSEGYTAFGIELSAYASKIAKGKFGEEVVFFGTFENYSVPIETFDVVTLFDVLEHAENPKEIFLKIKKILKPNGIVMVTTPNNRSWSHAILGGSWPHYKKEHLFYFNFQALNHLSLQNGMQIVCSEKTKKILNIKYLQNQFRVYPHWAFTPLINLAVWLLPRPLTEMNIRFSTGEITIVLKKAD